MSTRTHTTDSAYVHFSGTDVVHYAIGDGAGNIWPACNTRIGRYSLPWLIDTDHVTCKKCQKL